MNFHILKFGSSALLKHTTINVILNLLSIDERMQACIINNMLSCPNINFLLEIVGEDLYQKKTANLELNPIGSIQETLIYTRNSNYVINDPKLTNRNKVAFEVFEKKALVCLKNDFNVNPIELLIINSIDNEKSEEKTIFNFCLEKNYIEPSFSQDINVIKETNNNKKGNHKKMNEVENNVSPAIIVNEPILKIPSFKEIFRDCHYILRNLKCADFEISHKCCIILSSINFEKIASASLMYESVFLLSYGNEKSTLNYIGLKNTKFRKFPNIQNALLFVKSMINKDQTFLRDKESLHEYILSLFPTISKTLAQLILQRGNPILDNKIDLRGIPEMNYYPLNILLDAISTLYQENKKKQKRVYSKVKNLVAPTNKKIFAPKPNLISKYFSST